MAALSNVRFASSERQISRKQHIGYSDAKINYFPSSQIAIISKPTNADIPQSIKSNVRWVRVARQLEQNILPTNGVALQSQLICELCPEIHSIVE